MYRLISCLQNFGFFLISISARGKGSFGLQPPLGASLYHIEYMEIGWSDRSCVFDGSDSRNFNS